MYIKVRKIGRDPTDIQDVTITIFKSSSIKDIREIVHEKFHIEPEKQKLFYKGKLLVDHHCVMDYNIQLNDVIQLMIPHDIDDEKTDAKVKKVRVQIDDKMEKSTSNYYKISDNVDVLDPDSGAWFEGVILEIFQKPLVDENLDESHLIFRIRFECQGKGSGEVIYVEFDEIRPRAFRELSRRSDLRIGQTYLINYNIDDPKTRGYWYDFKLLNLNRQRMKGVLLVGRERTPINIAVKLSNEIMQIEQPDFITNRATSSEPTATLLRKNMYDCEYCQDKQEVNCKECGCRVCALRREPNKMLLCDECNDAYHIFCLDPPLKKIPEDDEWYCPSCKTDTNEIVKPGDRLKETIRKVTNLSRVWGKGMANVGRTKECTIVPKDHFGPIPGIEVGTCWKFRLQVSEAGVHRPHVAGIHGREGHGAYSLILSGGYEDDVDNGEEFLYTGSGGRGLTRIKRSNRQTCDQILKRMNKYDFVCRGRFDNRGTVESDSQYYYSYGDNYFSRNKTE